MDLYVILRRSGWRSPAELEQAAARSTKVGDEEMADDVRWIRSYVLDEGEGTVGTVCIYEATSPEAIREHAERAGLRRRDHQGRRHRPRAARSPAGARLSDASLATSPGPLYSGRAVSILPEDPLVRWIIWLAVAISIGMPLVAALVLMIVE